MNVKEEFDNLVEKLKTDLARRTGRPLILRSDPTLPACAWVLEGT